MDKKKAIIIGAGPAGLTAAYELLTKTNIQPIIIEQAEHMGGISRTLDYKGNRIDIGGHRFFSKSDKVTAWWLQMLPLEQKQNNKSNFFVPAQNPDKTMLAINRKSRIFYNKAFLDYPVSISMNFIKAIGVINTILIGFSYIKQLLFPIKKERNLEDVFINRFGKKLYVTFFKSYSEKVWGTTCKNISSDWGTQRLKGLSGSKTLVNIIKKICKISSNTETSLIEQFLYPKYGSGQMWETVAEKIKELGGEIITKHSVTSLIKENNTITTIETTHTEDNILKQFEADYIFSTMPMQDLINAIKPTVPAHVKHISDGLQYRDFIIVNLLLKKLTYQGTNVSDQWIYFQEPIIKAGRLLIMNNWSPHMVADTSKIWIGVEYFCFEGDNLWNKSKEELIQFAIQELCTIHMIEENDVIDATVTWQTKAYPAYSGTYDKLSIIKDYLNTLQNVYCIGRNGTHQYNNQDHSMLSAMKAVDNIINNREDKSNIWNINTEKEYHEHKTV